MASLCRPHSELLVLGGVNPQPYHELQPPSQQSTFDAGALWLLHLGPLTVSKPATDSNAALYADLGQQVPVA